MRLTLGALNLCLTVSVAVVGAVVIAEQRREIEHLKSQPLNDNTKVVTHGLEILSWSGKVVASILPNGLGEAEGAIIDLEAYPKSGAKSSSVLLGVDNVFGPSLSLVRDRKPPSMGEDRWAFLTSDGYTFAQGEFMGDRENPKASATLRLTGANVSQRLLVRDVGQLNLSAGGVRTVFPDGKQGIEPAGISLSGLKGDKYEAPSLVLNLDPQPDGTSVPGIRWIGDKWMLQGGLSPKGIGFQSNPQSAGSSLGFDDAGAGTLTLRHPNGFEAASLHKDVLVFWDTTGKMVGWYPANTAAGTSASNTPVSQAGVFAQAVQFESEQNGMNEKINAYMRVIALDPGSEYGKAAEKRIEQLEALEQSMLHLGGR